MSNKDAIWRRHNALANLSNNYGTQGGQPWYHFCLKDGRNVFLNMETGEERELPLSAGESLAVTFGSRLWQALPCLATLLNQQAYPIVALTTPDSEDRKMPRSPAPPERTGKGVRPPPWSPQPTKGATPMTTFSMTRSQFKAHVLENQGKRRRDTPSERRARQKRIARFRRGK